MRFLRNIAGTNSGSIFFKEAVVKMLWVQHPNEISAFACVFSLLHVYGLYNTDSIYRGLEPCRKPSILWK